MVFNLKIIIFTFLITLLMLTGCDDSSGGKKENISCYILKHQRINTENSAVSILFTVENCIGEPVPYGELTEDDFNITENDQELNSEAYREIIRRRGQEIFIILLLDMSDSTKSNINALINGAKKLVSSVLVEKELDVKISIELFDGSAGVVKFLLPTSSVEIIDSKLDELVNFEAIDGASTNLNGALSDSVSELQQYQSSYMQRNLNGVVTTGYVVLFTDGGDSAGRLDAATASNIVKEARYSQGTTTDLPTVQTYAVALKGQDYDPEALQYLIEDPQQEYISYLVEADSSSELENTFASIAEKIGGQVESTFLLAYCSSKRSGMATVDIGIKPEMAEESNTISFTFNSDGFGPGCNQEYFDTACDGLQCGGFNCGACDDSENFCDSETLQCVNYCLDDNKCEGEIITNPQGYEMECSFQESISKCSNECVDTDSDPNNCGECNNVCVAEGSYCEAGSCHCPSGGIECSGECVDFMSDNNNCGECGNSCNEFSECVNSQCRCLSNAECDGANLKSETCVSLGYQEGTLLCNNCQFDTSQCGSSCGNGVIDTQLGEDCEGTDLNSANCESEGYAYGILSCTSCEYDYSQCLSFSELSTGNYHTCALTSNGEAFCWGGNSNGRLGDGTITNRYTPTLVVGGHSFNKISAGRLHTCGIANTGDAYCWGGNSDGQLGNGTTTNSSSPILVTGGYSFVKISAGYHHTCGITNTGDIYCWGGNDYGQLGDGTKTAKNVPTLVSGGHSFIDISVAIYHTCGLTSTGDAYCWGWNDYGQLGNDATTQKSNPTLVTGGYSFVGISAGNRHTCGLTNFGATLCWGGNDYGQLGDGTTVDKLIPTFIIGGQVFVEINDGTYHTCGITNTGDAYCWGENEYGRLGDGTTINRHTPNLVSGSHNLNKISATSYHTCAITDAGAIYCWGYNHSGQLGDGTTTDKDTPTPISVP